MQQVNITVPLFLPESLYHPLRRLKRRLFPLPPKTLLGDRDVEWSFCGSHMPMGPGEALDFGSGGSYMDLLAARRGFQVTAIDLEPVRWPYVHPNLCFVQGDLAKLSLPEGHFDLVINCSTVEHVGLVGRFGVRENRFDGDLEAMARLWKFMNSGGVMLLTIPVGQDAVFTPFHRVYGQQRLPRLLEGFALEKEEFWVKDNENSWTLCDGDTALTFKVSSGSRDPLQNVYALGCFVLRRQ